MLLFEKTALFLSKKGADQYKYKDHIMVGTASKLEGEEGRETEGRESENIRLYIVHV